MQRVFICKVKLFTCSYGIVNCDWKSGVWNSGAYNCIAGSLWKRPVASRKFLIASVGVGAVGNSNYNRCVGSARLVSRSQVLSRGKVLSYIDEHHSIQPTNTIPAKYHKYQQYTTNLLLLCYLLEHARFSYGFSYTETQPGLTGLFGVLYPTTTQTVLNY